MSLAAVPNEANDEEPQPRALRLVPPPPPRPPVLRLVPPPQMTQRERVILSLIRCPEPAGRSDGS
jgi:hypothetical protein